MKSRGRPSAHTTNEPVRNRQPARQWKPASIGTPGYLDPLGNNFWGVEAFVRNGRTYVLASDRDSGLWIFRHK